MFRNHLIDEMNQVIIERLHSLYECGMHLNEFPLHPIDYARLSASCNYDEYASLLSSKPSPPVITHRGYGSIPVYDHHAPEYLRKLEAWEEKYKAHTERPKASMELYINTAYGSVKLIPKEGTKPLINNSAKAQSTDKKGNENEQVDVKTNEGSGSSSSRHESAERESGSTTFSINELRSGEWWDNAWKSCSSFWARVWGQIVAYATDPETTPDRHERRGGDSDSV